MTEYLTEKQVAELLGIAETCRLLALSVKENRSLENRPGRPHLHPRRCRRLCPKPTRGGGPMVYRQQRKNRLVVSLLPSRARPAMRSKMQERRQTHVNLEAAQLKSELARQLVPVATDDFEAFIRRDYWPSQQNHLTLKGLEREQGIFDKHLGPFFRGPMRRIDRALPHQLHLPASRRPKAGQPGKRAQGAPHPQARPAHRRQSPHPRPQPLRRARAAAGALPGRKAHAPFGRHRMAAAHRPSSAREARLSYSAGQQRHAPRRTDGP